MISSYIVDCNIMTDDCPFYCCIFWGTCIYQVTDFAPEQGRKADSPHLCGRSCFFCLAYEVKPRNRPHISSLSPAGAKLERVKRDECACGAAGKICNRKFSHAQENIRIVRGSLLTKDGLCKFLHRGDAPEPAEALLFWLLPAAWLNVTVAPEQGRKADSSRLRVRSCLSALLTR